MFSSRGSDCEGAGFLVYEAAKTGAAVVGDVGGDGCHCGYIECEMVLNV